MRRYVVFALAVLFAYSVYSLLSPALAVRGGLGALPLSSGMPMFISPVKALSLHISSPLLDYLLAFIYLLFAVLAWLAYQISLLLAHLLRLMPLPPLVNSTPATGIPPTSTTPPIGGGGGGASSGTGNAPAVINVPIPLVLALIAVLAVVALLAGARRRQTAGAAGAEADGRAQPAESLEPTKIAEALRPAGPPEVSADLPPLVKPRLVRWPLADDVPPVWPLGRPLVVEPAYEDVDIAASGCAAASSTGALVLSSDKPCLERVVARRGGEEEALSVKFSDLHREIANSFHETFKSAPGWMTAREIMAQLGAPPDIVEIFEKAAYSDLPLDYDDFAKFYRWLRGHEARI
ncbi:MAG: hypothetical protein ACP5HD_04700 [Thermoproteus sp.]